MRIANDLTSLRRTIAPTAQWMQIPLFDVLAARAPCVYWRYIDILGIVGHRMPKSAACIVCCAE